jgi:hypothetical protein
MTETDATKGKVALENVEEEEGECGPEITVG